MDSIDEQCQAKTALNSSCLLALQSEQNCSGAIFDALPDIGFSLGGQELSIPPSAYMASMLVDVPAYARLGPFIFKVYKEGVRCVPTLSAFGADQKVRWTSKDGTERMGAMAIFGQPFFRKCEPIDSLRISCSSLVLPSASAARAAVDRAHTCVVWQVCHTLRSRIERHLRGQRARGLSNV